MKFIETTKPLPFWIRLSHRAFLFWILSVLFFAALFLQSLFWAIISSGTIFICATIISANRTRYQICKIEIDSELLKLNYLHYNQEKHVQIDIDKIQLKLKPLFGKGSIWKLQIYSQNEFILHQENLDKWPIERLRKIYCAVLKEQNRQPNMEERINLNW